MVKRYWFKAKKYGWGWYPATFEGWVIISIYIVYFTARAFIFDSKVNSDSFSVFPFLFEILLPTGVLIVICYLTGEKPKWRWGDKHK